MSLLLLSSSQSHSAHLARVETLCSNEKLLVLAIADSVAESHLGKWCATSGVVDDVCNHALDVPAALSIVHHPETGRPLAVCVVRLKDAATALSLGANDATHLCGAAVLRGSVVPSCRPTYDGGIVLQYR